MSRLQTGAAKNLVAHILAEQGIAYEKLTARTVSFEDLARAYPVFVTIHGMRLPDPRLVKVREALRADKAGSNVRIEPMGVFAANA